MADERFTLTEFCQVARVDADFVEELVGLGIIEPRYEAGYAYFTQREASRCRKALRLQNDLELNLHGVALALELMEANTRLRRRVAYLSRVMDRLRDS